MRESCQSHQFLTRWLKRAFTMSEIAFDDYETGPPDTGRGSSDRWPSSCSPQHPLTSSSKSRHGRSCISLDLTPVPGALYRRGHLGPDCQHDGLNPQVASSLSFLTVRKTQTEASKGGQLTKFQVVEQHRLRFGRCGLAH